MKKSFYLLMILLSFSILTGCKTTNIDSVPQNPEVAGEAEQVKEVSAVLKINNGENEESFEFSTLENKSAFDMMKELQEKGDFDFSYQESNVGVFVESIGEISNDADTQTYWMLYVNDELASVGASDYILKNKDVVLWKYVDTANMDFK